MQEAKKQLELLLINYLRKCYAGFPKGRILPSESPDFVVRSKYAKKLGIELVRLHPAVPFSLLTGNEIAAFRYELVEEVKELFERSSGLKLFVKFIFSEKENIQTERKLAVSVLTTNLIRQSLANKNPRSFFFHMLTSNELPDGLEQVLLVHHPCLTESVWEEANSPGISENVIDDLHRVIQKKEKKLYLYQKQLLDEYWLLITSDRLQDTLNSNVVNRIFRENIQSAFNRVLLFDLVKSKVFELKMPSS